MDQYKLFLPILFEILKGFNNTISVKEIDTYLKVNFHKYSYANKALIHLWQR